VPELSAWVSHRHVHGDRLDPLKVLTLSEAARRPEILEHLGLTLTHFGLARLMERHRQGLLDGAGGVAPPRVRGEAGHYDTGQGVDP
jgi:hypothetical protein